jgi:membrane protein YdbS with pleckstrin-like domain
MKTYRSSFLRPWGSLIHGAGVISLIVAAWFGFLWLVMHSPGRPWRQASWRILIEDPSFAVPAALVAAIGALIVLHKFGSHRGRYSAGARELEIRSGWVWQRTRFLRYADITSIELNEGPLMRLLRTADLEIVASAAPHHVILHGVPAGEVLRRFLLERQESLRELASGKI